MSIDLTRKVTVATFVDTIVAEAGTYLGHNMIRTVSKADPTLRPYTRNLAPVFLASMTSFTQLFSREKEKPEKEEEKNKKIFQLVNQIITSVTALFSKLQAEKAKKALNISEQYDGAAHVLMGEYHRKLFAIDNPIAKTSENLWNLVQNVKAIDTLRSQEATSYLHCGYTGVLGSTLLSIGVYAMNPWMKTCGKAALVFTLVFSGYNYYRHRGDHEKIKKIYGELGTLGEKIRFNLQFFDNEMKAKTESDTSYVSLFKEFEGTDTPVHLTASQLSGINYLKQPAPK